MGETLDDQSAVTERQRAGSAPCWTCLVCRLPIRAGQRYRVREDERGHVECVEAHRAFWTAVAG